MQTIKSKLQLSFLMSCISRKEPEVTMQPRKDMCSMKSLMLINFRCAHSGRLLATATSIEG